MKKNLNKMNEVNITKNEVLAELVKPEITGHCTANYEMSFPVEGKEVKIKIDVTNTVTSSVAAQEKLDELAEKRTNRRVETFGKLISMFIEKAPEIVKTIRDIAEENRKYEKQIKGEKLPYGWEEKVDKLLLLLRKNRAGLKSNLDYLEGIVSNKDEELSDIEIAKWGIIQYDKYGRGLLNKAQEESLTNIGLF